MSRFLIGLLFLCGMTFVLANTGELSLKAADGSIIPARIIANNLIVTENGNPLPDGLYINTDYSTINVQSGKVLSYITAPSPKTATPTPVNSNDMITVNPQTESQHLIPVQLPAVAATPNTSVTSVSNSTTTVTTQINSDSKLPSAQENSIAKINNSAQPALKMSKPITPPVNLMKP